MSRMVMSVVSLAMGAEVDVDGSSNNMVRHRSIVFFPFFLHFLSQTDTINQLWPVHGTAKRTDSPLQVY